MQTRSTTLRNSGFSLLHLAVALLCLIPVVVEADSNLPPHGQKMVKVNYVPLVIGGIEKGQPLVKVRINKTTEATFLLDTGAGTSIISDTLAKRLGMNLEPAVADNGEPVSIFTKKMLMGRVSSLAVGDVAGAEVTYRDQLLLVAEDRTLNHNSLRSKFGSFTHIDGILGSNLLEHTALLVNVQDHTLFLLYPGVFSSDQLKQIGLSSPYSLPIAQDKLNAAWYATLKFDNVSAKGEDRLKIDTGSDSTIINGTLAKQLHLEAKSSSQVVTYGGLATLNVANVSSVHIGDLTLSNFPVEYQRDPHIESTSVFGLDAFRGYRVLIDFLGKTMYLQPNAPSVNIMVKPQVAPLTQTPVPQTQP